jgi:phosphoglycerate dehydrogenase-like enzyme
MRSLILAPFSDDCLARLRQRGDVIHESWLDTGKLYDPEALGARLAAERIDALVVEADFVFEDVFEAARDLRFVGVCRNALNQVDIDAATEHGVAVTHAPGRNTEAVAELTIGLMLALARRIPDAHRLVAGGGWSDPTAGYRLFRGREIADSTIGVVGFGRIGRAVARACLALGARVLAHDPFVDDTEIRAHGATPAALDELAAGADFVTLHVSDTPQGRRMVDAAFLWRMRRSAYLVNTSSGAAVDPDGLAAALEAGAIAGAALDVFEGQPLPASSPLMAAPRLLLTPHIGGATEETIARHSLMITEEIERLLDGRPLQYLVNPEYVHARGR